jgi:hypothetical protein
MVAFQIVASILKPWSVKDTDHDCLPWLVSSPASEFGMHPPAWSPFYLTSKS